MTSEARKILYITGLCWEKMGNSSLKLDQINVKLSGLSCELGSNECYIIKMCNEHKTDDHIKLLNENKNISLTNKYLSLSKGTEGGISTSLNKGNH